MKVIAKNCAKKVAKSITQGALLNQNEPEVTAYIAGLTTPLSSTQIGKLNTFVAALKTGLGISALSDTFDAMYILAGETAESALRNLVKYAHYATAVNSPEFTQFEGFKGNGSSSYINLNYNPSSQSVNMTLNSASFGIYNRTNLYNSGQNIAHGAYSTEGAANRLTIHLPNTNGSTYTCGINGRGATSLGAYNQTAGILIGSRTEAARNVLYRNKINIPLENQASTTLINRNILLLARDAGTIGLFDPNQISFAFIGKGLTQTQCDIITDAIEAYMDSNGKGVIA